MKKYCFLLVALLSVHVSAESAVGGVDHLGLSVDNLDASERFFIKYGGFSVVKRDASYPAVFLNNGSVTITLWQVVDPENPVHFNRKTNVGLHHAAFSVSSFSALEKLYLKLKRDREVNVEFSPELLGEGPTKHMMVYEPSGNRIEFIHRP